MKKNLIILFIFLSSLTIIAQVKVRGYVRSNGTYVAPHIRSSPNSTPIDNYSYPSNTNPYTGKTATGSSHTYLKNYYNSNNISTSDVWVDGYTRSDGTYVQGHWRSAPNGNPYDNYSYPGNTNPYTGKTATGNPSTYLNNSTNNPTRNSKQDLEKNYGPDSQYMKDLEKNYGPNSQYMKDLEKNYGPNSQYMKDLEKKYQLKK